VRAEGLRASEEQIAEVRRTGENEARDDRKRHLDHGTALAHDGTPAAAGGGPLHDAARRPGIDTRGSQRVRERQRFPRRRPQDAPSASASVSVFPADVRKMHHPPFALSIRPITQSFATRARLAMELMLWTGQRRIDAIWLGPANIVDGFIKMSQSKTGKDMELPIAPQLLAAIVSMPPLPPETDSFLRTAPAHGQGKRFTNAGFGNWFRERCDEAGLPQCSAHGLRKAIMRRMAELSIPNQPMKAVSGHTNDEEVALYTAAANQRHLATEAIRLLSEWEQGRMSNLPKRLAIDASEQP
jgi:integrase